MKYKLISLESTHQPSIDDYLADGWELYGNPTCNPRGLFIQAVVKHEEAKGRCYCNDKTICPVPLDGNCKCNCHEPPVDKTENNWNA